jgi:hypothetical protein
MIKINLNKHTQCSYRLGHDGGLPVLLDTIMCFKAWSYIDNGKTLIKYKSAVYCVN